MEFSIRTEESLLILFSCIPFLRGLYFKIGYALFYQFYAEISTFSITKCLVRLKPVLWVPNPALSFYYMTRVMNNRNGNVKCETQNKTFSHAESRMSSYWSEVDTVLAWNTSRKLLRINVTPDLHLTYSKNGGILGLVLKIKNIACISILLTKHINTVYLFIFV